MDGEVDQITEDGTLVREHLTRLQPANGMLGLRWEPPHSRFWAQAEVVASDEADRLSLRDRVDTQRIPPGGTPSWIVGNVRAGYALSRCATVTAAVENVTDENYRFHGSGVNEPGINVIVALDVTF
jgi:hemoglobin/transferrin/lactoferrin receptor protein